MLMFVTESCCHRHFKDSAQVETRRHDSQELLLRSSCDEGEDEEEVSACDFCIHRNALAHPLLAGAEV